MERNLRVNEEITGVPKVHLIMNDGRSAGEVSLDQAKYLAEQYELDLVELNGNLTTPIVKLMDYNKYRYQQEKHARQTGAKNKGNELKEVRLSFTINQHDLQTKAKRAKEFLADGHFVKVYIQLRGRENVFPDKAKQILTAFSQAIESIIEQTPTHIGKRIQIIVRPKKK